MFKSLILLSNPCSALCSINCPVDGSAACRLIAELEDVRHFDNVHEILGHVSLNPRQHQSSRKWATDGSL